MAKVARIKGDWPEVILKLETSGNLDLGNVGRLFQRVNTGVRAAYPVNVPRIEIVQLESGSIVLRIAILSATLTAAQLALQISDHLQSNAAASRTCRDLFAEDNANRIVINGGQQKITISEDDIDDELEWVAYGVARERQPIEAPRSINSVAEGSFTGTIERITGEYYIQLSDRPGLFLRIQDNRAAPDIWLEHTRYRVQGRAFFAPIGKPSAFVVEEAFAL